MLLAGWPRWGRLGPYRGGAAGRGFGVEIRIRACLPCRCHTGGPNAAKLVQTCFILGFTGLCVVIQCGSHQTWRRRTELGIDPETGSG